MTLVLIALTACSDKTTEDTAAPTDPTDDTSPPTVDDTDTPTDDSDTPPVDGDNDGFSDDVDCDDTDPAINPKAKEVCDGVDNNCDKQVDEGLLETWYHDGDGDGYGDPKDTLEDCAQPSGYVSDNQDCDDSDKQAYPGADEVLDDGVDQDCDGEDLESTVFGYMSGWDGTTVGNTTAGQCLASQVTLHFAATVTHIGMGVEVYSKSSLFDLGIYEDDSGVPGDLLAGLEDVTLSTGYNEVPLKKPLARPIGDVWVAICNPNDDYANGIYKATSYIAYAAPVAGSLPDPFGGSFGKFPVQPAMWVVGY